jgi:alanine racemase
VGSETPGLPAEARIDLAAVRSNVAVLCAHAPTAAALAVVKADAYGHGLVPCARAAQEGGADWLGVAKLAEAFELRRAGVAGRLVSWVVGPGDNWTAAIRADVDVSASSQEVLDEIAVAADQVGTAARVHLKIDTGLARSGVTAREWPGFIEHAARLSAAGSIQVVGIWSHLASADEPRHPTIDAAVEQFRAALGVAAAQGLHPEVRHLANTAATIRRPDTHFDLVRIGIGVYGLSPGPAVGSAAEIGLIPVMTLAGRLILTKEVPAGTGVSYGHIATTDRTTTLGLLPLGYADGIPRAAGNAGPVLIRGERRKIIGRVCMDQFIIDVDDLGAESGDEVIIFGNAARGEPTAEEWASVCGTINYEIVTRIGQRVPRIFGGV